MIRWVPCILTPSWAPCLMLNYKLRRLIPPRQSTVTVPEGRMRMRRIVAEIVAEGRAGRWRKKTSPGRSLCVEHDNCQQHGIWNISDNVPVIQLASHPARHRDALDIHNITWYLSRAPRCRWMVGARTAPNQQEQLGAGAGLVSSALTRDQQRDREKKRPVLGSSKLLKSDFG